MVSQVAVPIWCSRLHHQWGSPGSGAASGEPRVGECQSSPSGQACSQAKAFRSTARWHARAGPSPAFQEFALTPMSTVQSSSGVSRESSRATRSKGFDLERWQGVGVSGETGSPGSRSHWGHKLDRQTIAHAPGLQAIQHLLLCAGKKFMSILCPFRNPDAPGEVNDWSASTTVPLMPSFSSVGQARQGLEAGLSPPPWLNAPICVSHRQARRYTKATRELRRSRLTQRAESMQEHSITEPDGVAFEETKNFYCGFQGCGCCYRSQVGSAPARRSSARDDQTIRLLILCPFLCPFLRSTISG